MHLSIYQLTTIGGVWQNAYTDIKILKLCTIIVGGAMRKKKATLDTSNELVVQKWGEGFKLIEPNKTIKINEKEKFLRVSDLLTLPVNVAFLDTDSVIRSVNETIVKVCGFVSINDTVGKTVRVAAQKEAADFSIRHDQAVLKTKRMIVAEENFVRNIDDFYFRAITCKFPWYDMDNQIIGILCLAISNDVIGAPPFEHAWESILRTGLLNRTPEYSSQKILPSLNMLGTCFSEQQAKCVYYLLHGMPVKKIASKLGLEPKTVINYLDYAKIRMNVSSKADLIEKVIDYFNNL